MLQKATLITCKPLDGFTYVPVDIDALAQFKQSAYSAGVGYRFGAKDPSVGSGKIDFTDIDCSGWFRTLSDFITREVLREAGLPDGSYLQAHWLISQGFKNHRIGSDADYDEFAAVEDDLYRVCFHYPSGRGGDPVGHVWADVHEHSVESYGGHGPGERPIEHPWFRDHCDLVVVIGPMVPAAQWIYQP